MPQALQSTSHLSVYFDNMFCLGARPRIQTLLRAAAEQTLPFQGVNRNISVCTTLLLLLLVPCSICDDGITNKTRVTREDYYQDVADIPNICAITFKSTRNDHASMPSNGSAVVPFIGTPLVRDAQLLLLRLYYSIDYFVKYFIVVVSEKAWEVTLGGLGYELQHLKEYGRNVVVITCQHPPAVVEGWNAITQAFPEEPWGMVVARDTAFVPGSLHLLARHMTEAVQDGNVDVALTNWTTIMKDGEYNAFAMTRSAMDRFGLFDEKFYPAYYEDNDFQLRQSRMGPPLKVRVLSDVMMVHGKQSERIYVSGLQTAVDPLNTEHQTRQQQQVTKRYGVNGNYLYRKWGCPGFGPWQDCLYETPFNKSVPVWYWQTSKHQRQIDQNVELDWSTNSLVDANRTKLFRVPARFTPEGGWAGYNETLSDCRVTGKLGVASNTSSRLICI